MSCRFLYDNKITAASMLTLSSNAAGIISAAAKDGTGSATMQTSGTFTGSADTTFVVEIDSVAGGAEIASATFKWSNDGGSTWEATGVATDSDYITLENGVQIKWTAGTGDDFVSGDQWTFRAVLPWGPANMLEWNRDRRWRSATLDGPNTIVIDFGAATTITALVIYDHNFTSGATIHIQGHTADSWGTPDFDDTVTWASGKILHYLSASTSKRYWRLTVSDATNTDTWLEIGHLFLGTYLELSTSIRWGFRRSQSALLSTGSTSYGINFHRFFNVGQQFSGNLSYPTDADMTSLRTMLAAIASRSAGTIRPIYFNKDSATVADNWMAEWTNLDDGHDFTDQHIVPLSLSEVMTSA